MEKVNTKGCSLDDPDPTWHSKRQQDVATDTTDSRAFLWRFRAPRTPDLDTREGATAVTAGLARFGAIGVMAARCSEAMHSTKPFHALAYLCHLCRGAWADSRSQQTAGCTGSCQGLLSLDRQQICGIHTVFISAVKVRSASLCPWAGLATWTGSRGALFDWRADERTWCIATRD